VLDLLAKDAIEIVPPSEALEGYYSTFFLVPKKDGGQRPILNLKPLNLLMKKQPFKMVTLRSVIKAVQPGDWLYSLDLKDAYFHIPVRPSHRKFLRFAMFHQAFQFKVLPFGATAAPRVFTKVLAEVMALIRLRTCFIYPYLDDCLGRDSDLAQLSRGRDLTLLTLKQAGFIINLKKSNLEPTQDLAFIGAQFRTDLGMVFLPMDRAKALIAFCKTFRVGMYKTAREYMRLLGFIASTLDMW
jgi:hypothetical protein